MQTISSKTITLAAQNEQILSLNISAPNSHSLIEKQFEKQNFFENAKTLKMLFASTPFCHTLAWIQGFEHLFDMQLSSRSQYVRVILCEGERIIEHIATLGRIAKSVGLLPLFMKTQHIQQKFEQFCLQLGIRKTIFIPGGTNIDFEPELVAKLLQFFEEIPAICNNIRSTLLSSRIFKGRATKTAYISAVNANALSLTGTVARASGITFDVRHSDDSKIYSKFPTIISRGGDAFTRTSIRLDEITQSLEIIKECSKNLPPEDISYKPNIVDSRNQRVFFAKEDMDSTLFDAGVYPIAHEYSAVEAPDGEFGIFLVGNGECRLQRCKLNCPSFYAMQALEEISVGEDPMDIELIAASLGLTISREAYVNAV
ncbi:MAG: hypothetical protein LBJ89_03865 [Holosporales bacterium]|jgi:NADH-quinone oxidoreductase subunit D|nr:hypothetical protein [Holosporales bacterium]